MILLHIHDERRRPPASRKLAGWNVVAIPLDRAGDVESGKLHHCLIDVDVTDLPKALRVRALPRSPERSGQRLFACERGAHHALTQARALGATRILPLPLSDRALLQALGDATGQDDVPHDQPPSSVIGSIALDLAFRSILEMKAFPAEHVESVASAIVEDVDQIGIEDWLRSIRAHHEGTYQHCLIVTGLAAAFGRELRLSASDVEKLTVAALLHDIGKARIDAAILDKKGALTAAERAVVERHPVWGEQHLREHAAIAEEILDVVRHHHEMLDGSGYPDGLKGEEVSDLTRLLTIVDIFGALVEQRAYKPPMPGDAAFAIVSSMASEGKLERALVEAFRPVAARLREKPDPA